MNILKWRKFRLYSFYLNIIANSLDNACCEGVYLHKILRYENENLRF